MQQMKCFPSGLRLVVNNITGMYSVSCGVLVGVGSLFETTQNNGYAHFVEHMMFKGTKKRTAFEISKAMDNIGGQMNAYTSKDITCYYTRTTGAHFETSIDILSDMLFNSLYEDEELLRERDVILEEITMSDDTPDEVCHELLAKALYDKHPLSKTIAGPKENILSATRDKLLEFIKGAYKPNNIVISIAGNVDFDAAVRLVEKHFESQFGNKNKCGEVTLPASAQLKSRYLSRNKDIEQCHISLGMPSSPIGSELTIPIAVLSNAFGGSMSSRLFQNVREKNGLAYSVFSYVSSYVNNAYFEIYVGTNPKNIDKLTKLLREEILVLRDKGLTAEEISRGKEQLKGGTLLSLESTAQVMTGFGSYLLRCGKEYDIEEKIERINSVDQSDIAKAIDFVFGNDIMSAVYVGKKQYDADLLKMLRKG